MLSITKLQTRQFWIHAVEKAMLYGNTETKAVHFMRCGKRGANIGFLLHFFYIHCNKSCSLELWEKSGLSQKIWMIQLPGCSVFLFAAALPSSLSPQRSLLCTSRIVMTYDNNISPDCSISDQYSEITMIPWCRATVVIWVTNNIPHIDRRRQLPGNHYPVQPFCLTAFLKHK